MSRAAIRKALETALGAMSPALATAWENLPYTPVEGTPYQRPWFLWAEPGNAEYGRTFVQGGTLHILLAYPLNAGPADAQARADLIRATFKRGYSFTADGVTTTIYRTPTVATAAIEGDLYQVPVQIPFFANITS